MNNYTFSPPPDDILSQGLRQRLIANNGGASTQQQEMQQGYKRHVEYDANGRRVEHFDTSRRSSRTAPSGPPTGSSPRTAQPYNHVGVGKGPAPRGEGEAQQFHNRPPVVDMNLTFDKCFQSKSIFKRILIFDSRNVDPFSLSGYVEIITLISSMEQRQYQSIIKLRELTKNINM